MFQLVNQNVCVNNKMAHKAYLAKNNGGGVTPSQNVFQTHHHHYHHHNNNNTNNDDDENLTKSLQHIDNSSVDETYSTLNNLIETEQNYGNELQEFLYLPPPNQVISQGKQIKMKDPRPVSPALSTSSSSSKSSSSSSSNSSPDNTDNEEEYEVIESIVPKCESVEIVANNDYYGKQIQQSDEDNKKIDKNLDTFDKKNEMNDKIVLKKAKKRKMDDTDKTEKSSLMVMLKNTDLMSDKISSTKLTFHSNYKVSGDVVAKGNFVKKPRGRYKKSKIDVEIKMDKVAGNCVSTSISSAAITPPNDPIVFSLMNKHIVNIENGVENFDRLVVDESNDKRFADYMTSTSYYMFVVCKSKSGSDSKYRLFYANCVSSVTVEYAARYSKIDNLVMVVSYNRYRFMISYDLLKEMKIAVPVTEDFSKIDLNRKKNCHFNEVKDFEFYNLLTNTFHLDMIFVRANIFLMLSLMGERKGDMILKTINEMNENKLLYTLPVNFCRKEACVEDVVYDVSPYVENVIKHSLGMQFKKMTNNEFDDSNRENIVSSVVNNLKFWLREKTEKSSDIKNKNAFFTYKYGSIVRLLYDENEKNLNKMIKIKKDNNGNANLIESYLNLSGVNDSSDNCLLVTTKSDERITIIKQGVNYIWITSVIKDIIPLDIVDMYKKHRHHVFNLNKLNRKEINNKHNGMIKLIAFYTGQMLTMDEIVHIAQKYFECNYQCRNFDKI
ncbi:immediately early 1 [Ectropis obliqua nucleopolyhedrovirus]|uniref:Immediately early 1 n=1 Tax=Ectropis obliqua nucleopolyhedrovirus TaxID=59376 RepID=A0EYQ9_9ABAC|nr:immediately early 1 [Ectropis obliqua nucleopolyhedrovirus]ABI35690.1 immediately early 1 [Ectropis obliqua nucleopolyhedrovirus]